MATFTTLTLPEIAATGFTHKVTVPYTDLTSLTSGSTYSIFPTLNGSTTFVAGSRVQRAKLQVTTAFAFSPGTLVIKVGDGGDDDRFIASSDLKTAQGYSAPNSTMDYTYQAADTIDFVATAGAGALSSITAGSFDLYLSFENQNGLIT